AHEGERLGDAPWLVLVERRGAPGLHVAETARAGAGVAEDHDGGDAAAPALAHVRAPGLFTDRVEPVLVHDAPEALVAGASRDLGLEPRRFFLDRKLLGSSLCVVQDHPRETQNRG